MSQNEDIGKLTNSWPILLDHFKGTLEPEPEPELMFELAKRNNIYIPFKK